MHRTLPVLLACLLFAPAPAQALPKPAKSEYFLTAGAGFAVEKDQGLYYAMTYRVRVTIDSVMYGTVIFQNPSDKKNPFIVDVVVNPGDESIVVQSPVFNGIKNNKNYRVEFKLYEAEAKEKSINRHVDKVNFSLPESIAMQMGINLL